MRLFSKVSGLLVPAASFGVILGLLFLSRPLHAAPPASLSRVIPSQYIVVFKDTVNTDAVVNDLAGRFNMSVLHRYSHALHGMAIKLPPALVNLLAADPRVDYIEQDVIVSINAQTLPTGINRINANDDPVAKIDNVDNPVDVDIAILDTGIDLNHPDLNLYRYAYCKSGASTCTENDPGADDGNSHGTHVAGIAAARDNNSGVVGVAPGARLWAVKVLENNGSGTGSQILAGIDYVTANASEIEVANMSLTGDGSVQWIDDAISNAVSAGIVFTLAAGNASKDVANVFPAGSPDAITVSALEDYDGEPGGLSSTAGDDTFANFSNFGSSALDHVDIMAPGVNIRSTVPGGGLGNKSGTSMASPHVAGAAALYLSQNPGASPAAVKTALLAAADPAPCVDNPDGTCGPPQDPDGVQEPLLLLSCKLSGTELFPAACSADGDNDGLTYREEILTYLTDPADSDTDNDGLSDGAEVNTYGTDPLLADTDTDGLSDSAEINTYGTNPLLADTDTDGLSDGDEVNIYSTDPLVVDTDGDGLSDGFEVNTYGSDPLASNRGDLGPIGALDGVVNIADYLVLTRLVTGELAATSSEITLGDLNNNNGLDAGDLVLMLRVVNGEIPLPP